jgi:predicted nucleic acid-binding protein
MGKRILVDTGFWFALYDSRDRYHDSALSLAEYLNPHWLIVPWPSLYETLNTRFVRRKNWLRSFEAAIHRDNVILLPDGSYRESALIDVFSNDLQQGKPYSLVDLIIREMLSDKAIRIDAMITFNFVDFIDICAKRNIALFDG